MAAGTRSPLPAASVRDVEIPSKGMSLSGLLAVPAEPRGVVAFVHGSGSSRFSRRNLAVAAALNEAGLGTLLFDLLTAEEELDLYDLGDFVDDYRPTAYCGTTSGCFSSSPSTTCGRGCSRRCR